MNILVAGGSGNIGQELIKELTARKHAVVLLSRNPEGIKLPGVSEILKWDGRTQGEWCRSIGNAGAIINLSGVAIEAGRWTKKRKKEIIESRIVSTRTLVEAISEAEHRPQVLINASAVGYYGNTRDLDVNEDSPQGKGFLSGLCKSWEKEALNAGQKGVRVALLRTGVVLHQGSAMLRKMSLQFKLFAGGYPGSGAQWIPWIHIADVVGAIIFILENPHLDGPINLTSPHPVTMKNIAYKLGGILNRPSLFSIPPFLLKTIFGEMSSLILEGQKAIPHRLMSAGFIFDYPDIETALRNLIRIV